MQRDKYVKTTDTLPTPMAGNLDDLLESGDSSEKPYKVFVGHNLGHRVFLLHIPMHEFFQMSEVANDPGRDGDSVAQRKLDPAHAQKLAVYILKGLVAGAIGRRAALGKPALLGLTRVLEQMGRQPYLALQPIVTNIRESGEMGRSIRAERIISKSDDTTAGYKVFLSQRHVLWVIDGQHRRMAMKMVFDFLEQVIRAHSYPKKSSLFATDSFDASPEDVQVWQEAYDSARTYCTVNVEVHLGLTGEQERQLFHDLNNLGKRVDRNLALKFDNSNPINLFIKEYLHEEMDMKIVEKDVKEWKDDVGAIALKDVVAVNAVLFLNKTNIGGALPAAVTDKIPTAKAFWEAVNAIPHFGEAGAKDKIVAAQPVVLKAIAKLVYDFGFSNRRPPDGDELLDRLLGSITDVDFSHDNPMWRYYELSQDKREAFGLAGLASHLPLADGANRDLGSFQAGVMRFGAKHNDIYPILGDMIRWKLGLPSRHN